MHAVVNRNKDLAWEERPDPVPGDTELLVTVQAAGINGADLAQRRGGYPAPPGSPPDIPGLELAGTVAATGGRVGRFRTGDRVMAIVGGGGQATMATVDETHALRVPPAMSWPEAGGFPEVFFTAYDALWSHGGLTMGDRVLVTGAAGGVGTAAVQLAAAAGAHVVASVRAEELRDGVRALGAHEVIDPAEVPGYGPYDVALELVGAPSLPDALAALRTGGRIVVIGVGAGPTVALNLLQLMVKRARIAGSTLRPRSRAEKAELAGRMADHVLPLVESGRVRVPVHATHDMADAVAAYDRFARGAKLGKIVLTA
jgi:NADPH:quinone reductase-like Zn-dependent oxidoreductase